MIETTFRLILVAVVAAIMALAGLGFLLGRIPAITDGSTTLVLSVSVILWLVLSAVIQAQAKRGTRALATAIGFGLLSPLIGGMLAAPPISLLICLTRWYVSFPIGAVTGFLVWLCVSFRRPQKTG